METIEIEKRENVAIITLPENAAYEVADALKKEFVVLNNEGQRNFILDLNKTKQFGTTGLHAVLIAHKLCKESGGICVLTHLSEPIKKLIKIAQLEPILQIENDLDSALNYIFNETNQYAG